MYKERYKRFIEKVESFSIGRGGLEPYDMHTGHWHAFMEGTDDISRRVDSIYRAYKFGMLQALRFASKHSREECAEIVRGVDQRARCVMNQTESGGEVRQRALGYEG